MFGAIGRILGKKAVNSMAELKKVENKDLMEAIVAASLLVAYADGSCGDDEILKLDELVRSNPALAHFGSEISQTINRISAQLKANFLVGRVHVKREIGDIKNNKQDAEEVFVNAIAMAQADGDISADEKKVLQEIGREFGLRLEDYGLQG
ncbi:tellurite resistance [Pseudomonas phage PMBT3]|uniref:Tellurite resistance protein n=1 Tax=Pseudomonas phage PMBT3 TaxID=2059856 RepID=A0A2I6PHY0_9CAUD|nr:tellurite resistance [Pseudomonas phage PMBT3]AUM59652.1 tellurite resistance protein [Pseudomonas phage PMBT3]